MDTFEHSFAIELERIILLELNGDGKKDGLYRAVIKGVPDFDRYNRLVGEIKAYEFIYKEMKALFQRRAAPDADDVLVPMTVQ